MWSKGGYGERNGAGRTRRTLAKCSSCGIVSLSLRTPSSQSSHTHPASPTDLVVPLLSNGKQRPASSPASSNPTITCPAAVDEALVSPPYIISLVSPSPASHGSTTPAPSDRPHFTLEVHTLSDLAPVQSLAVPPESPSPPASIAASSLAALHGSSPASRGPTHTAKLLTLSSTSPKPPLLVLTTKSPHSSVSAPAGLGGAGSPEQTLWAVTMKSWPDQIEELGREEGKWEEGIELLRGSFDALKDPLPVSSRFPALRDDCPRSMPCLHH
jgi:hypothetical protein